MDSSAPMPKSMRRDGENIQTILTICLNFVETAPSKIFLEE